MFLIQSVSWGISDGHIIHAGLQFLQGGVNGDTRLMFSFQFLQDTGIVEGALSHLMLLKYFYGSFDDPSAVADQMTSSGKPVQNLCVQ